MRQVGALREGAGGLRRTGKGEYGRLKFLTCDWRREDDGRPRIIVKFGGRKCNKLRFGARVEGVWPRVELSGAWSGWFKGSREINEKPLRQQKVQPRNRGLKSVFLTGVRPQLDR